MGEHNRSDLHPDSMRLLRCTRNDRPKRSYGFSLEGPGESPGPVGGRVPAVRSDEPFSLARPFAIATPKLFGFVKCGRAAEETPKISWVADGGQGF